MTLSQDSASDMPVVAIAAVRPYRSDEIAETLGRFGALLRTSMDLPMLLQAVSSHPGADMAGVTTLSTHSGQPETVACTDERALDVDIDQYRADEGPCLESARTRQVVRVRVEGAALAAVRGEYCRDRRGEFPFGSAVNRRASCGSAEFVRFR